MKRDLLARIVNLVVPGSGLILQRREWLGLGVALLFAALAQIAILGRWVIPLEIPRWAALFAAVAALLVWGHAQWLLNRRIRLNASPVLADELLELRRRAAAAIARGDYADAQRILQVARSIDDEDADVAVLWAQLKTAQGERASRASL